jgi:hypothetical protein
MFKNFWRSGYIVLLLYVLGIGFWIGALFSGSYKAFFCAALVCIVAGFVRSLPWLWRHRIFERPHSSSPYTRRYSDSQPNEHSDLVSHEYAKTHAERRRHRRRKPAKRRKLRWAAEVVSALLFIAAGLGLKDSYVSRSYKEPPILDVLLSDRRLSDATPDKRPVIDRVRARRAPFLGRRAAFREKVFIMAETPTEYVPINEWDKSVKIDVILENLNGIDIPNAHVTVESDVHITPVSEDLVSLTDKQLYGDVAHVTPPDHSSDERIITVEIPIPKNQETAGIYVTVQADNMKPYGAVARIVFVRNADASLEPGALEKSPR